VNKIAGEIEVKLGDETILLRPSFEGLIHAEAFGKSMVKVMEDFAMRDFYMADFVAIIFSLQVVPEGKEKKSFSEIGSLYIVQDKDENFYANIIQMVHRVLRGDKKKEPQDKKGRS